MIYQHWHELKQAIYKIKGDLYIAGAGNLGRVIGEYFNEKNISWIGYLDKKIIDEKICDKNVYPYAFVKNKTDCHVIISSTEFPDEIRKELLSVGVNDEQLFMPIKYNSMVIMDIMDEMYHVYELLPRLCAFHNLHLGKRCFVIGNGPSLTISDLEKLRNEISLASNSIFALYQETTWRPTYYGVTDPEAIKTFKIDYGNTEKTYLIC